MSTNILLVLFIFLFTHLQFYFASSSNSGCAEIEWKALMDFKGSLVDEGNRLSSWTERDCCSWYGITCHNRTGFVQMIDLSNNGGTNVLRGLINSCLLNLEHLEYNEFSGIRIPAFLGSLRNLQYLKLYGARFSGEIPQHVGNLSNLHHLYLGEDEYLTIGSSSLSSNSLSWIARLSSLRSLELTDINLSESVDWLDSINKLSSLSSLRLANCELVGMSLSHDLNLPSLVSLDLSRNNLDSALPPSFFNLSSLKHIRISNSILRGSIPDMFQKLTALNDLDLSLNSFSSSFPCSLCTLTGLKYLDLSMSELQGSIPLCLGKLSNLTYLNLRENEFSGAIPSELGSLTQLRYLSISDNQFSSRIPLTLGKLIKLRVLDVFNNSLIGELSESFFEGLMSLEFLDISKNHDIVFNVSPQWIPPFQFEYLLMDSVSIGLRTTFPFWLRAQTNLKQLSLRNASIFGVIPQTSYPQLHYFDLSDNSLSGLVPKFDPYPTIDYLALSNNQLTGTIPNELCDLRSLIVLKLDNNMLIGRIPSCIGNLQDLRVLDLANNSISDHIPNELGYLNQLDYLQLNGNKLFGELPWSLQNLTALKTLDLGKNELQGCIPNWIGKELLYLEHLLLQSNNFSGEISLNICQLPSLRILNLPDNSLVGTIPHCLGNLSRMLSDDSSGDLYDATLLTIFIKGIELEYSSNTKFAKFISLSGNHLHGTIPYELMNLTELQSLNLSNNKLTGKIPERIGNMKHLESLDLSRNHLSGTIPQSLAGIDTLGYLSLSFNNLFGRIPSGGHFDTFDDPSVYEGNGELCGKPTTKSCDDDLVPSKKSGLVSHGNDDSEIEIGWLYAGIGPGFAVGFLGVFFLLYFKNSWRHRYFTFLDNVYNRF